jgi:TonB family protein
MKRLFLAVGWMGIWAGIAALARAETPTVYEATELDEVPVPLLQPKPALPAGVAAEPAPRPVDVALIVNAQGVVRDAKVVQAGVPALDEAAVAVLARWRFRPGKRDGQAVEARLIVPVAFSLPDATGSGPFAGPVIVPVEQLDRVPMVRYQTQPVYPADLRRKGIGGEVLVEFVIDERGLVRVPRALRAPHQALGESAENAVGQWTFFPGMKDGRAVATRLQVPIEFTPAP